MLNAVLVQLADVDVNLLMGPAERRRLLRLLSNMTGRPPAALEEFYVAFELVAPGVINSVSSNSGDGDVRVLEGDSTRNFKTRELLDKLDKLGAFKLLLGSPRGGPKASAASDNIWLC